MAELNLNSEMDLQTINLSIELNLENGIVPVVGNVPIGLDKGIYFWYIKVSGLNELSGFVSFQITDKTITKIIDGEKYALVYIGSSGTGKSGGGNLTQRLNWHIGQNHSESNICHGTLSTLRAGLGALISDDLIIENTEAMVNQLMKTYFKVYWIQYNDVDLIDSDEFILIQSIKPYLNLKNNPSALLGATANPTQLYKRRRALVYANTRARIGCGGEESEVSMRSEDPSNNVPSFGHQLLEDTTALKSFFVMKGQRIDKVVRGIEGLPKGHCSYAIFDSKGGVELMSGSTGRNVDVNPDAQNIYTYFSNSGADGISRYRIIEDKMSIGNIEEIIVKVWVK